MPLPCFYGNYKLCIEMVNAVLKGFIPHQHVYTRWNGNEGGYCDGPTFYRVPTSIRKGLKHYRSSERRTHLMIALYTAYADELALYPIHPYSPAL